MDPTDIELVMKAKTAGDDRAFALLVRRHQARLRAFLIRLSGGDRALADDLAQNAFMRAHARLESYHGGGSFRSWLYSIAYREFLQSRRKEDAERRIIESAHDASGHNGPELIDANLSIDLQAALVQLSELERAAVLFCDAAGLSHAEAAAAMNAPLGSVKTYVARARSRLRELLSPEPLGAATDKGVCHAR